jgi:hypothetical protein
VKTTTRFLNGFSMVLAFWALFVAIPYDGLMRALALLPPLALGIAFAARPAILLNEDDDAEEGREAAKPPNLFTSLTLPGAALGARAFLDINLIDWFEPALVAVAGGFALAGVALWIDGRIADRIVSLIALVTLMMAYAYGLAVHSNRMYDQSEGYRFETTIKSKHSKHDTIDTYHLTLAPWGENGQTSVMVEEELYDKVEEGGSICMYLHPGRLGWRWSEARIC